MANACIWLSCQDLIENAGKISAELAQQKALTQYNAYKSKSADEQSEVEKQFIETIEQAEKQLKKLKENE